MRLCKFITSTNVTALRLESHVLLFLCSSVSNPVEAEFTVRLCKFITTSTNVTALRLESHVLFFLCRSVSNPVEAEFTVRLCKFITTSTNVTANVIGISCTVSCISL